VECKYMSRNRAFHGDNIANAVFHVVKVQVYVENPGIYSFLSKITDIYYLP
jgi:hypothetical protein